MEVLMKKSPKNQPAEQARQIQVTFHQPCAGKHTRTEYIKGLVPLAYNSNIRAIKSCENDLM